MKEFKLGCFEGSEGISSLEFEDIQQYVAKNIAQDVDNDMMQFDMTKPFTLDLQKHDLAQLLNSEHNLPAYNRK